MIEKWKDIAVWERAAVLIWEWEFRGVLVAAANICVCIGQVVGKVENSSLEQGCRTQDSCHPTSTWLGASQTRRLMESRKICLVDPSFPCGPGRGGGFALGGPTVGLSWELTSLQA